VKLRLRLTAFIKGGVCKANSILNYRLSHEHYFPVVVRLHGAPAHHEGALRFAVNTAKRALKM
jgi:hypothetical protein